MILIMKFFEIKVIFQRHLKMYYSMLLSQCYDLVSVCLTQPSHQYFGALVNGKFGALDSALRPIPIKRTSSAERHPHLLRISKNLECKYSNQLTTGLVNGRFVTGCQMVQFSHGGLKTKLQRACLWSKMSSIGMVCQIMWLYNRIPDTHTIWYSGIHMVTICHSVQNVGDINFVKVFFKSRFFGTEA